MEIKIKDVVKQVKRKTVNTFGVRSHAMHDSSIATHIDSWAALVAVDTALRHVLKPAATSLALQKIL